MDTELVMRAQQGDEGAFVALADSSVDRLLRVAQGILGDAHLAEDATQQALLSMWREPAAPARSRALRGLVVSADRQRLPYRGATQASLDAEPPRLAQERSAGA